MTFTFDSYKRLINAIRENGYQFADYHDFRAIPNPCILRHDIDYSLERVLHFAKLEKDLSVKSTYFVLVTSDFYNPFSSNSKDIIKSIKRCGHEIGLHFDEVAYKELNKDSIVTAIQKECSILEDIIEDRVTTVSMHRPSKWVLEADLQIPEIVNSYGKCFFHDFKFVSDSRMRWREDVMKYVTEKSYQKLHILTHAFWYGETELSIQDVLDNYLNSSRTDRYKILNENFTDLSSVIKD
ncbi:MAG: hypothetical protein J5631_00145 [Spirochaetaceae bacterium]|nr:hypothetical protein [Spirochaetaceae bacterium]